LGFYYFYLKRSEILKKTAKNGEICLTKRAGGGKIGV